METIHAKLLLARDAKGSGTNFRRFVSTGRMVIYIYAEKLSQTSSPVWITATVTYTLATFTQERHQQVLVNTTTHEICLRTQQSAGRREIRLCLKHVPYLPDRIYVINRGDIFVRVSNQQLAPRMATSVMMPAQISLGDGRWLDVRMPSSDRAFFEACRPLTTWSSTAIGSSPNPNPVPMPTSAGRSPSMQTLNRWFSALAAIQRRAACSQEFFGEAVDAMIDPGGLDTGMLLMREHGQWTIHGSRVCHAPRGIAFEPYFADLVLQKREALVYHPSRNQNSSTENHALFAAPVFGEDMEVVAVLYGSRRLGAANRRREIRQLEAHWIQLLAEAVTSGFIRLKQEADAARQRVLLEQVFPSEVVRRLAQEKSMELPAEQREVTLMFADLTESTAIAETQSPELTCRFLADVMDTMTSVIHQHQGVVVDYYGDGLIAMWNAPLDQPDHARLACQAGLAIRDLLTARNSLWQVRFDRAIQFGIGIHSGDAIVGNSGSRTRLKYGPRGLTVNLTNRIEKATRYLNQTVLISDATRQRLPMESGTYRLGQFRLWGIDQPLVLHALHGLSSATATNPCCLSKHREVIQLVQSGDYAAAANRLDACHGCALDELSLKFIQQQLTALTGDVDSSWQGRELPRDELTFDLTKCHGPLA